MSTEPELPRAARIFVSFVALLRANGFAVAPEQTTSYLAAIALLGPRDLNDIRQSALATLAPPPERRTTFDRLFDLHFRGSEAIEHVDDGEDDETVRLQEEGRGEQEPLSSDEANESGLAATRTEALVERRFAQLSATDALRRLARDAPRRLPQRRGHRRMRARRGPFADLRRTLRDSVRSDGEILRLGHLKRRQRRRKLLLLIDVSGSMKTRTEENMKLAHTLVQAAPNVEVFTFGTRLTRVTRPLRLKRREQALKRGGAPRQRLGRRHPHRRRAASLPRGAAVRRLRARRGRRRRVGRAGAWRTRRVARRGRKAVAARLARELADAARDGPGLPPADRGAGCHRALCR
ncbi:uncharacterized protein with von Willebrand factor type A (vWA) domain [Bradyrhizobium barranii subsp. barranii]